MNNTQIDLLAGATLCVLYVLYILVRIFKLRNAGWFLKLLAGAMALVFPMIGAMFVHLFICLFAPEPRDDRVLGVLGLAGAGGALLAFVSTYARFAVHDVYPFCFILLGFVIFIVLAPFVLRFPGAVQQDWKDGLLSVYPKWVLVLAAVTILNMVAQIAVYTRYAEYGVPRERSGSFFLETNDRPTRRLTEEEYYAFSGYFVRGTSSAMFAFFLVPALFYLRRRRVSPVGEAAKPAVVNAMHQGAQRLRSNDVRPP